MLFNSYIFIFVFLPFSFFMYFYLLQKRLVTGAKSFLVFSSLFFYSWWNIDYLPIILVSMLFNYVVGNALNEKLYKIKIDKKMLLFFGVLANVLLLGYFKYMDFLIENINFFINKNIDLPHLVLPLAISFFTFQQIAYLVDSYRGETREYDFLNYALFVTFFPQLIAGPIVHHAEMMPQFSSRWNMVKNYKNIAIGLFIFSIGLFKKVVIADTFAVWATAGFDTATTLNLVEAWITSLSYTFQIYFDFSGYTDMAIGIALLFNIKLPINFNSPYKSLTIQDFWRRWHITLSRFLKEYIYIPLGGNRKGSFKIYVNLMITFLIGGIWHGAGWTFVFWGFLHGFALVIHRIWKQVGFSLHDMLAWFITFNFINIAWVFFRAKKWEDAMKVLHGMFDYTNIVLPPHITSVFLSSAHTIKEIVVWLSVGLILLLWFKNSSQIVSYPKLEKTKVLTIHHAIYFALLFMFSILYISLSTYTEFIYFNF